MDNNMMYDEGMDFGLEGQMDLGMVYGRGEMMGPQFGGTANGAGMRWVDNNRPVQIFLRHVTCMFPKR